MDAKVTVEEMAAAIEGAKRNVRAGSPRPMSQIHALTAARDYIIAAESQIAEAMDVLSPSMRGSGLVDACRQVKQAAISEAGNARKLEALLAERDTQIAEMRKVTGPKCPKCGHWLKAEHRKNFASRDLMSTGLAYFKKDNSRLCITVVDLLASHPLIAAELGLTEANDGK